MKTIWLCQWCPGGTQWPRLVGKLGLDSQASSISDLDSRVLEAILRLVLFNLLLNCAMVTLYTKVFWRSGVSLILWADSYMYINSKNWIVCCSSWMFSGLAGAEPGNWQTGNPGLQSFFSLTLYRLQWHSQSAQSPHHQPQPTCSLPQIKHQPLKFSFTLSLAEDWLIESNFFIEWLNNYISKEIQPRRRDN